MTTQIQLFMFTIIITLLITWKFFYNKQGTWKKRLAATIIFILGLYTTTAGEWITDGDMIIQPLAYILILISLSIGLTTLKTTEAN